MIDLFDTVLSGANELLAAGRVDLGISPVPFYSGLSEEIEQTEFVAVAHRQHPLLALGRELEFNDLKTYRQIIVRDSGIHKSLDVGWLGSEQHWTVSNIRASVEAVTLGFGFAWLPLSSVVRQLEAGELVYLPMREGKRRTVSFYLNYLCEDQIGVAAREFIDDLRNNLFNARS